jgi:hypothetical protein
VRYLTGTMTGLLLSLMRMIPDAVVASFTAIDFGGGRTLLHVDDLMAAMRFLRQPTPNHQVSGT